MTLLLSWGLGGKEENHAFRVHADSMKRFFLLLRVFIELSLLNIVEYCLDFLFIRAHTDPVLALLL